MVRLLIECAVRGTLIATVTAVILWATRIKAPVRYRFDERRDQARHGFSEVAPRVYGRSTSVRAMPHRLSSERSSTSSPGAMDTK